MSAKEPPTRRRWLRRSLRGVVLLVLVVLVLPSLLVDSYVRGKVEAAATESLGARVTLGALSVGWWSRVEVESLLVHAPGTEAGVLLASDAVEVDTGLLGLLFGSAPLRVTVLRPRLNLQARDGRLNLLRLVDDLPTTAGDAGEKRGESTLPSRGVDVRIEGGRIEIGEGPTMATYALEGGVACEALDAAPLSCRFELVRAAGGRVTLDGSIAGWNSSGSAPVVTGSLEASRLDLDTLAVVLESTADVYSTGVVDHLLVSSKAEAGSTRLVVEADVKGLSVARSNAPFGPPLESVSVRLGGQLNGSSLSSVAGSITLPQGSVTLDPESRVTWSAAEIDGAVRLRGVVDDLTVLQDAIAGLLPDDVDLRGHATIAADVAGRWDRRPGVVWTKQLERIGGSLEVTIGGLDVQGTRVDEIVANGTLANGVLTLSETRATVGGGQARFTGSLPLVDPTSGGVITWQLGPRVTLERAIEGAGMVTAAISGTGTVGMREEGMRLHGMLELVSLSAPDLPSAPLDLRDGALSFDMQLDPAAKGGRIDLAVSKLTLAQPLAEGACRLGGVLSGTVRVSGTTDAARASIDLALTDAAFGWTGATQDVAMDRLTLQAAGNIAGNGGVTGGLVRLFGDGVEVQVQELVFSPGADDSQAPRLSVDATIDAGAARLSTALAPWMPEGLALKGGVHVQIKGSTSGDDPLDSLDAFVALDVSSTTFDGHEITDLILHANVKQGRATVREGRARLDGGTVTLGGAFGMLETRRVAGDALTLTVTDIPFTFDQELEPTAEGSPRRISTAGNLGGNIVVTADDDSRLKCGAELRGTGLSRDLVIGTATSTAISLPDLALSANGVLEGDAANTVRISDATVTGTGIRAEIANLTRTGKLLAIGRAEAVLLPAVLDALLLGSGDDPMFRPTGEARVLVTDLSAPADEATGEFVMKQVAGTGEIALAACSIKDLDGRNLLCSYELKNRAVHVLTGSMTLSGGTVTLSPGTLVGLGPEQYPFRVNAVAKGVQIQEGLRTPLSILNPLFLADANAKDTRIEGQADLTVDCGGAWSRNEGWSRTITGTGAFKLTGSTVRGSALLTQLASSADGSLSGSTVRAVLTVLGESGKVGRLLATLAQNGYAFEDVATALDVRGGRVHLRNGIGIKSKDLVLKLSGSASLEGELDYRLETDLVARLKDVARKQLKDDPGGGLLGTILGAVSSLSLVNLVTAELGVTVTGNALQGTPAFAVSLFEPARK